MLVLRKFNFINLKSYLKSYSLKYIYEIIFSWTFVTLILIWSLKKNPKSVHSICNVNFLDGKEIHYYY